MPSKPAPKPGLVLWADDDRSFVDHLAIEGRLFAENLKLLYAGNGVAALQAFEENRDQIKAVILDIRMAPGEGFNLPVDGNRTGLAVARAIRKKSRKLPILLLTLYEDAETLEWAQKQRGYSCKLLFKTPTLDGGQLVNLVARAIKNKGFKPKCFIVHGRDEAAKLALKGFLQERLGFDKPVILHEQSNLGRTIIEKFEREARDVDLVFVLLTPDDLPTSPDATNDEKRRARQNVIFELGWFYGKLQRTTGRVLLLAKKPIELPSDIAGLIYIDITNGIDAAGEEIRRQLGL